MDLVTAVKKTDIRQTVDGPGRKLTVYYLFIVHKIILLPDANRRKAGRISTMFKKI